MITDQAQTEQSAVNRIMGMLDQQDGTAEPVKQEAKPEAKEPEQATEQPEVEASSEESQAETQPDSFEVDPDAKFIEVEVTTEGGEKRIEKLSLNELKADRMRQADYTRKTQEVARQRDEVPEKIRQGINEHLQKSVQQIQSLQALVLQSVAPELQNVDFNKLAREDPSEWVRLSNRAREVEHTLQALEQAKNAKQAELKTQQDAQFAKFKEESQSKIKSKFPNYDEIQPALRDTAVKRYGFTTEQLDAIHHPGFAEILHDAHEYQKTKSATKTIVDKKVVNVPKVLKPGTPKDPAKERVSESFKKLQKSGRIDDAAAAIFHTLK